MMKINLIFFTQTGLKRKVNWLGKGEYLVVENSEKLEALYTKLVEGEAVHGFAKLKARAPKQLCLELAETLGLRGPGQVEVDSGDATQQASLDKLYGALSAPKALLNVAPQKKGKGKGKGKFKGKGKKGQGKAKGKDKNKDKDKGKGKGERERKPGHFTLHLEGGERRNAAKAALQECLENALRAKAGLKVTEFVDVESEDEQAEALVARVGAQEGGAQASVAVAKAAPATPAPAALAPAPAPAAAPAAPGPAVVRRRFLVYVEGTEEERDAKRTKGDDNAQR